MSTLRASYFEALPNASYASRIYLRSNENSWVTKFSAWQLLLLNDELQ